MAYIVDGELLTKEELEQLAQRRKLFESLGFSETDAFDMALAGVSMAAARELVVKGCAPDLAAQILL